MKIQPLSNELPRANRVLALLGAALMLAWSHGVAAAPTDLASEPIASAQSSAVKPNIMVLMDASDSMRASHMPDDLEQANLDAQPIGYRSYQCNPMYYNPNQTYVLPKMVDTTDAALPLVNAPTPSFTAAPYNYYNPSILSPASTTTVDLSVAFQAFDFQTRLGLGESTTTAARSDTPQAAYYYTHSVAGSKKYTISPCTDPLGTVNSPAGGTWTKVLVPAGQQANFAIWYTYYRTRIALVKSGIGRAFKDIGNNYRVGFITVSPLEPGDPTDPNVPPATGSAVDPAKYQPIDDFSPAQRQNVYNKLYTQTPGGASPAREGLARVGRHYSDYGSGVVGTSALRSVGINKGMPEDPVQYSCQRNYTIMTTDGYWNKTFETAGAVKMDGVTKVGQQDSPLSAPLGVCDGNGNGPAANQQCAPRPMYDGGTSGNYVDQQQSYDYQALTCSSGNDAQTVTNYTRSVEQYFNQEKWQKRQTDTLTYENTQTTKVTTTQTVDQQQLKESVTHAVETVTKSTQRDTVSTQSLLNLKKVDTQVLRNDVQQQIQYKYLMMTVKTATKETWTRTVSVVQWQQVGSDGSSWHYVSACSAATAGTSGCRHSSSWAVNAPVDPDNCSNQTGDHDNHYKTITCSTVVYSGLQALNPNDSCIGDNDDLRYTPLRRQTCKLITTISYVDPTICTNGSTTTQVVTCGATLTPTLSAGPASGDNVASCTPQNQVTANLNVPSVSAPAVAGTTNNYQRLCPTLVVPAPGGATVTNVAAQQYLVDPATCAVTAGSPPTSASTTNGTGVTTTCTPSITNTPIAYTTCGGPCSSVAASNTNSWTATDYSYTSNGPTYVSRSVCPSSSTTDATISPFTETVCTLVSDSSYYVDTSTCVAGPTTVAGGITRTCGTAAVSGPTAVASCTAGFDGTNTTTCTTYTDVALHGVAACTYGVGSTVVGTQTYTCGNSSVLGIAVEPGSCTVGSTTNPVTGVTTTCNAQSVVTTYVTKGGCTPIAAGSGVTTVVDCPAVTVGTPLGPVTQGFCAPGTVFNSTTGYTSICTNTHTDLTLETVGTACPGAYYDPGLGTVATGTISTDPTTKTQTKCVMYDSGPVSINSVCTVGLTSGTNLTQEICSTSTVTPMGAGVACTSSFYQSGGQYYHQTCNTTVVTPSTVVTDASCQAAKTAASSATPVTSSVSCVPIADSWQLQSRYTTRNYTQIVSGGMTIGSPVLTSTVGPTAWANEGACTPTTTTPMPVGAIPSVLASAASPVIAPVGLNQTAVDGSGSGACGSWPCRIYHPALDNGSQNSLADVAEYYYATDLRAGMTNNIQVPSSGGNEDDRATHQHMVTYTVALGVSGILNFNADYRNPANLIGDFPAIRAGAVVTGQVGHTGLTNWPVWPTAAIEASLNPLDFSDARSIDDFWHAAVNGRGQYFSAGDASGMVTSIQNALDSINSTVGSGNGATTSTPALVATDNTVFVPSFRTVAWTGDIQAQIYDFSSASIIGGTHNWSAQQALQLMVAPATDNRHIVFRKAGGSAFAAGSDLADFNYANLVAAGNQSYFDATVEPLWSQYGSMNATQIANAPGVNLVNFLRGQRGNENFAAGVNTQLYRKRDAVLGDIVGSQPTYVKGPTSNYADAGYSLFKTGSAATRKKMVYVGANDGMLHAFYAPQPTDSNWADAGKEAWAYVPSQVMPNMYKLADVQYSVNHQFFVDGTVTVGDICISNPCAGSTAGSTDWRTILVGGFNDGGRGYYALDITVPDQPKSLWEFTLANNANLGFSFGRPIISKLVNGQWVVMFTSGYNNADGNGYLYILNAKDGVQTGLSPIATGAGSAANPSGLREINNWVNNVLADNTTQRVYGGDLLGNVWRFDVNGAGTAMLLATLKDPTSVAQPITTRLELAEIGGDPYVYAGTGRLLGLSDLSTTQQQSVYSFKDIGSTYTNGGVADGDVRPSLKQMGFTTTVPTLANGLPDLAHATRTIACISSALECAHPTGWMVDLPESGERMNIDFRAGKGTLAFVTNVPTTDFCSAGHSWLNYVDEVSGNQIPVDTGLANAGVILDDSSLAVGVAMVDVTGLLKGLGLSANGQTKVKDIPWASPLPVGKRISWREVAP